MNEQPSFNPETSRSTDPFLEKRGRESHFETARFLEKLIGGEVTANRVSGLVKQMRLQQVWLHGIKEFTSIENIIHQGIHRRTPEGGQASYWTSGWRVFVSDHINKLISTYDTPFFHYGHTRNAPVPTMCFALTSAELIGGELLDPSKTRSEYIALHKEVPPQAMDLLIVQEDGNIRETAFENLEAILNNHLEGGRIIRLSGSEEVSHA